jgi:uncharacterized protein (DUF1015 family)
MVDVQPLRGLRYAHEVVGDLAWVVSPPSDVISPQEQASYHALSPYNILQVEWGKELPNDNEINNRYTRSANLFSKWCVDGVLVKDNTSRYYLYQQTFEVNGRAYTRLSLVACVRLEPRNASAILAHERTVSQALPERLKHLRATTTHLSPIMCLYDDPQGQIRDLLLAAAGLQAEVQVRDPAGGRHLLSPLTEPKYIQFIQDFFRTRQLYIADGHHRYETALTYREELRTQRVLPEDHPANFVLVALIAMNDPGLVILPTHRLVSGLSKKALKAFSRKNLSRFFRVQDVPRRASSRRLLKKLAASSKQHPSLLVSTAEHLWLLRLNKSGRACMKRSGHAKAWNQLEVAVAQHLLLEEETTQRTKGISLSYTHDIHEALQAVHLGRAQVAILLNATPVKQLRKVVQAGEVMPAKSTCFYPKVLKGLVMHSLV